MSITEALNELFAILSKSTNKSETLNAIASIISLSQDGLPASQTGVARPSSNLTP